MNTLHSLGGVLLSIAMVSSLSAQQARNLQVQKIRIDRPQFFVHVDLDRNDARYPVGSTVTATVTSSRDGYLYLIYKQATGESVCIYPNNEHRENAIQAKKPVQVPAAGANFLLRVHAPTGSEELKAIVTDKPLSELEVENLRGRAFTIVDGKNIAVETIQANQNNWSEHSVKLKTYVPEAQQQRGAVRKPRRIVLIIGTDQYRDHRIPNLPACKNDALAMSSALKQVCSADEVRVLTGKQATKLNILKSIRALAADSAPGDEVIIYWSGHGARFSDVGGEEKDGYDEVFLTYDSNIGSVDLIQSTCIFDDELGRLMLDLNDRKILVILDTCHSGGGANNEKSLSVPFLNIPEGVGSDLFENEVQTAKDIGVTNIVVLASSRARQKSFVRIEEDMSVMSYELSQLLHKTTGPATIQSLKESLVPAVQDYVQKKFFSIQTPVLIGDADLAFLLVK